MQKRRNSILFIFLSVLYFVNCNAQSLSTKFPGLEDFYRREQLLGNIGLIHSFVSYPLFPTTAFEVNNPYDPTNSLGQNKLIDFESNYKLNKGKYTLRLLPIIWEHQYNSHHPEGLNDGTMIPARGYQTRVSMGFFFKYDHLTIKIQPELVHAANLKFDGFPLTRENPDLAILRWHRYYVHTLNYIDQPEQFGEDPYNQLFWGQSSIRLTFNAISLGFSIENLWWGPGMRNSLLMTNNAPGFAHLTLNTVKPLKTWIGFFEGQIISGWLKNSGYPPPNTEANWLGAPFYVPKPDEGRYINAMILSYQPKWIPGLFIGLIRSFQMYHKEMDDGFIDYFPIFTAFGKKAAGGEEEVDKKKRDVYNSVFFRFVWPESHVEIYGEYGRSDYYWDHRDLKVQQEHSVAYNLGFRKLISFNKRQNEYLQIHFELTQLAKNANTIIRGGHSWYASAIIRHGYTHKGQLLGAGIGPGSNIQTLNISWIKSLKMIGLQLERYVHNEDFFFDYIQDIRMHWVDISAAININWDYKNLLFILKLKAVKSFNYQWVFDYNLEDYWDASGGDDIFNFNGQLGVIYRF